MRLAAGLLVFLTVLAGAGCGGSSEPSSTTAAAASPQTASTAHASAGTANVVSASAGPVTATMHAGTHTPQVGRSWPFTFTVTRAGLPAHASVAYQYLLAGQVVAHRSHYTFTGHFSDFTIWPAAAAGYPLTLRAVIVSGAATILLDYPVRVSG